MAVSPFHALCLLARHHEFKQGNSQKFRSIFNKGVTSAREDDQLDTWLADGLNAKVVVDHSHKTINDCPVRRTYESTLSLELLRNVLKEISSEDIQAHYDAVFNMLSPSQRVLIEQTIYKGGRNGIASRYSDTADEYITALERLGNGGYDALMPSLEDDADSVEQQAEHLKKLELLIKSIHASMAYVMLNQSSGDVPINDVYCSKSSAFSAVQRGRKQKNDDSGKPQQGVHSKALGILTSLTPNPYYGPLSSGRTDYQRSVDARTYEPLTQETSAGFVESTFRRRLVPYVNSRSGVVLCLLRTIDALRKDAKFPYEKKSDALYNYLTASINYILWFTGGHSRHELMDPFWLPEVRRCFDQLPVMEQFFSDKLEHNWEQVAFDKARSTTYELANHEFLRRQVNAKVSQVTIRASLPENYDQTLNKLYSDIFIDINHDELLSNCIRLCFLLRIELPVDHSYEDSIKKTLPILKKSYDQRRVNLQTRYLTTEFYGTTSEEKIKYAHELITDEKQTALDREVAKFYMIRELGLPKNIRISKENVADLIARPHGLESEAEIHSAEYEQIFNCLKESFFSANKHEKETIKLPFGQALVLLIGACQANFLSEEIVAKLKRLYIEGKTSDEDSAFVDALEQNLSENYGYNINFDSTELNEDTSRRFYETWLSWHWLQHFPQKIDVTELRAYSDTLQKHTLNYLQSHPISRVRLAFIDKGQQNKLLNKYQNEYAELISKLQKKDYFDLSDEACDVLLEIARATIYSTLITQHDKSLPVDVYSDSVFEMGISGRGRQIVAENAHIKTASKGIMRNTSALPRDGVVLDEDTEGLKFSSIQRSADQGRPIIDSKWVSTLFSKGSQVYSNGISSTTLATLRNILNQNRLGNNSPVSCLKDYLSSFIALMIYNSGGHSLYEIFEVFKLFHFDKVFDDAGLSELISKRRLMSEWILSDSPQLEQDAFKRTVEYTKHIVSMKCVGKALKNHPQKLDEDAIEYQVSEEAAPVRLSVRQALLSLPAAKFTEVIRDATTEELNEKVHKYSPLMLAAQLGKVEQVRALLDRGVYFTQNLAKKGRKYGLSALELSIKHEHVEVLACLIDFAKEAANPKFALIKGRSEKDDLYDRSPSLYFAVRQSNPEILKMVLTGGEGEFDTNDYYNALLAAVDFENIKAIPALLGRAELMEFSQTQKLTVLKSIVKKGNFVLLSVVSQSSIFDLRSQIGTLLQTSANKKYFQVVRALLSQASEMEIDVPQSLMNDILISCVKKKQFSMALVCILHGASPSCLPNNRAQLDAWNAYMRRTNLKDIRQSLKLTTSEEGQIKDCVSRLESDMQSARGCFLYKVIDFCVWLLSHIPYVKFKGYYANKSTQTQTCSFFKKISPEPDSKVDDDIAIDPHVMTF